MNYLVYKAIHIVSMGGFLLTFGLLLSANVEGDSKFLKWKSILYNLSWGLILLSAIGLVSVMGLYQNIPTWVILKFVIWFCMGALTGFVKAKPQFKLLQFTLFMSLFAAAVVVALYKPFM